MSRALELLSRRIELFLAEKRWTQADLSESTGISRQQLNKYIKARTPPGLETIEKIAKALGRPISDLFSEEITVSETAELLRLWQKADEDDRDLVLRILRGDEGEVKSRDRGGASGA